MQQQLQNLLLEEDSSHNILYNYDISSIESSIPLISIEKAINQSVSLATYYIHESNRYTDFIDCFEDGDGEKKRNIFSRMWSFLMKIFGKIRDFFVMLFTRNDARERRTMKMIDKMKKDRDTIVNNEKIIERQTNSQETEKNIEKNKQLQQEGRIAAAHIYDFGRINYELKNCSIPGVAAKGFGNIFVKNVDETKKIITKLEKNKKTINNPADVKKIQNDIRNAKDNWKKLKKPILSIVSKTVDKMEKGPVVVIQGTSSATEVLRELEKTPEMAKKIYLSSSQINKQIKNCIKDVKYIKNRIDTISKEMMNDTGNNVSEKVKNKEKEFNTVLVALGRQMIGVGTEYKRIYDKFEKSLNHICNYLDKVARRTEVEKQQNENK